MPETFAESSDGVILIANGMERPLRWDGYEVAVIPAGVKKPETAVTMSGTGSGQITGTYFAFVRFVDKFGNYSDLSPVSNSVAFNDAQIVSYSGVPVPTEAKVVRRQVLRNTAGQTGVFYVDVDTDDTSSTVLASVRTDSALQQQEVQVLLDADGRDIANVYGLPPDHKPLMAYHLDRMWAAGEVTYAEGSIEVTHLSTTVTGHGTDWRAEFAGRYIHIAGASQPYLIDSVDVDDQTLELLEPYADDTDLFAAYAIKAAPAEASLLYFSEPGKPEAWPAVNALSLPEDGDTVTGLMPRGSFLYILKRRRIYRATAQDDPLKDGFIFLTAGRGCVNNRCWVIADEVVYLLDEGGIHAFDGTDAARSVSGQIQTLFRTDGQGPKINWSAARFFHAVHDPGRETIRWFVALHSDYLPRHALAYAYRREAWWIEEYPVPIGASALGRLGRPSGVWHQNQEQVFLGSQFGRVLAFGESTLDGLIPQAAKHGNPTAVGLASLTDSRANFPGLSGVPVAIAAGRGAGQVRVVVSNTATKLSLDRPWAVKPDTNSVYQLGGLPYRYRSALMRMVPAEAREGASIELSFEPVDAEARLTLTHDYGSAMRSQFTTSGVGRSTRKEEEIVLDLSREDGSVIQHFDRHREGNTGGPRFVQFAIDGVSGDPPVRFGEQLLNGVV